MINFLIALCISITATENHIEIIEPIFDTKSIKENFGCNSYPYIGVFADCISIVLLEFSFFCCK